MLGEELWAGGSGSGSCRCSGVGLDAREGGREGPRLGGRDGGFEPGGEERVSSWRLLRSSESIQLRWSSGCSSSKGSLGGETGVIEPELRLDASLEAGIGWREAAVLNPAREKLEARSLASAPGDGGRDPGGVPSPGVETGEARVLQGVGANPAEWAKYDAVSALATRSMTWSWYDGRSTCGMSEWARTPESPKRRFRAPAEARRASSARQGARIWMGRAHLSSET